MKFYRSNFLSNILVFALGLIFIITPTAITSTGIHSKYSFYPDLFLCFIFSTNLNRPKRINLYLILSLVLFSDILHMKPIGLFTILVLTSFIVIGRFQQHIEKSPFYTHYFIFFIAISGIQMFNVFLHHLLFIPNLSLITIMKQTIFTLICYPLFDIPYKLTRPKKI